MSEKGPGHVEALVFREWYLRIGFDAFYSFCRQRGGYSGVVTFVKHDIPTVAAEEGLTGLWQIKDSVGHLGFLHHEVVENLDALL